MKLTYTSANGRIVFEVDVSTGKQAFEVVAAVQELFEEECCGCCKSTKVRCQVRHSGDGKYVYYSLVCGDCAATLDFGQKQDGKSLFVKRQDKDTKAKLPNNGWYHYQR
jgi:hypothetical protein